MRPPETIVFDLDGTLVDTAPDLTAALNAVLIRERLPPVPLERVRQMVGRGARVLIERALAWHRIPLDPTRTSELLQHFLTYYEANIAVTSRPFEGMETCVRSLSAHGHRIGICTNKPEHLSRKLIAELGLADLFPVILGADSRPWRKPDPRHLTDTIEALGGEASNAVLVGDSDTDARTARAAGVPVVLVSFGYTETPAGELDADAVVDHFRDLEAALVRLARALDLQPKPPL
ncbi:MAG: phosphoglycolate phosphatase [Alphaproteobacteria bacterium]